MALARRRPETKAQFDQLKAIIRRESLLTGGDFKLASGAQSSVFFDMKKTLFDPEGASLVGELILDAIAGDNVEFVGGLELGAVPIATAICVKSVGARRPLKGFFVRKEPKGHGTNKLVDGQFKDGADVIVLEDVTTTGGSSLKAVNAVRERGAKVRKVVTIVDRLEGAEAAFAKDGIELVALFDRNDFLDH
jgi:orotate phosphoribosyltransferase